MKKKRILSILLAIMMVAVLLTGCGNNEKDTTAENKGKDESNVEEVKLAQGVTDDTIKIGTIGPTSGPIAMVGIPMLHGMEAYFNMINEQGGINGRKIELVAKDDEFKADLALQKAEELVEKDKVFAIVGQLGTPGCLGTLDYFQEIGIPCIYQGTGVSAFAQAKGNYFPVQPNYTFEGSLIAKYAVSDLNAKSVVLIYGNDDSGKEGMVGIKEYLKEKGKEDLLKEEIAFNLEDVDFSAHIQKAKAQNPDVVIVLGYQKAVPGILLEAKKQGLESQFMTSYINADVTMLDLAKEAANGVLVTAWVPDITDSNNESAKQYIETFLKYYPDETPNAFGVAGWVAAETFVEGLKRAENNLSWEGFIQAMETFDGWSDGIAKGITYTPDRRNGVEKMYFMKAIYDFNGPRYETVTDFMGLDD